VVEANVKSDAFGAIDTSALIITSVVNCAKVPDSGTELPSFTPDINGNSVEWTIECEDDANLEAPVPELRKE
jgi:hypothetical protein